MDQPDEQITCAACGESFLFSSAEAKVYAERNLASPPKRCKECRKARKAELNKNRDRERVGGRQPGHQGHQAHQAHQNHGHHAHHGGHSGQRGGNVPRFTGDVNEYRSPMQDNYSMTQQWPLGGRRPNRFSSGNASGNAQGQGNRGPRNHAPASRGMRGDGNYRAPSFTDDARPARAARPARESRPPRVKPTFSIQCNSCGAESEVPFKPEEGREVFCQACYKARRPQAATE